MITFILHLNILKASILKNSWFKFFKIIRQFTGKNICSSWKRFVHFPLLQIILINYISQKFHCHIGAIFDSNIKPIWYEMLPQNWDVYILLIFVASNAPFYLEIYFKKQTVKIIVNDFPINIPDKFPKK